jgi:hypothetical protein
MSGWRRVMSLPVGKRDEITRAKPAHRLRSNHHPSRITAATGRMNSHLPRTFRTFNFKSC